MGNDNSRMLPGLTIALKNALSYACGLLSRSLNAAMSDRLHSGILNRF